MTVFSIPFWIPTTYKPYLSEIEPFAKTFTDIRNDLGDAAYFETLENFKTLHIDKYDYLAKMICPDYEFIHPDYDSFR